MDKLTQYLNAHPNDELHPSEIANLLKDLSEKSFDEAVQSIPKELIADVALELPDRYFEDVVESFTPKELADSLAELESDDQTDFIRELEEVDDSIAKEVFNQLDKDDQADILHLKQYDEDEAGAYMQTEVYAANLHQTVHDVIREFAELRRQDELENVTYLFVTDEKNILRYRIGLDNLLVFDFDKTLQENIEENPEKYKPIVGYNHDSIHDIVQKFQEYDLSSMPIVDYNGALLGRITSDDIYDIINEHATDQMYNLAGVNDDAEEDEDIFNAGKARAVWLGVNLMTAIAASLWFDKGMLGVVIALSMVINLLSAGFFGSMVPLFLKKMEVDPAIGSTVILTTVTDVVGFFSFLGLATIILL